MPQEDVNALIKKAVTDDTFRNALSKDFDKTVDVHQINLSADEANALKAVNWKSNSLPSAVTAGRWVHIYQS